jgi:predicted dehydrogenase
MEQVRVGLVGAGGISRAHLRGYAALPDQVRVAAVADVAAGAARGRAEEAGGAAAYGDLAALLAGTEVDAVDICLPHHLHADAIITAARAGKHVLCEKPLCLTTEEADRVAAAVSESGVMLMCAHNQLFLPPVAAARAVLDSGRLGTVYELRVTDSFFNDFDPANMGWRANRGTSGGGELIDTGYHPTYLLLHLAGSAAGAVPAEVTAMLSRHRLTFSDGEDSAQVLVRFTGGALGSIVTSWAYEPAGCTERFSVVGEQGSLWSDGASLFVKPRGGEVERTDFEAVDTFGAEIADFVACVRGERKPINSVAEGTRVLRVILAAYASSEQRRTVPID